jgi:N,N-dimethylformamidase
MFMVQGYIRTMKIIPLIGYTDKLSARAGETIGFKLSNQTGEPVKAQLYRSISADPNPKGVGIIENEMSEFFEPQVINVENQAFNSGSYGLTEKELTLEPTATLSFNVKIFPTLKKPNSQCLLAYSGLAIFIDKNGEVGVDIEGQTLLSGHAIKLKNWYDIKVTIQTNGAVEIVQKNLSHSLGGDKVTRTQGELTLHSDWLNSSYLSVAANHQAGQSYDLYNGKIESPAVYVDDVLFVEWDFSQAISSTKAVSNLGVGLCLHNFPARAMTSSDWDASEMCWRHKPEHYAAIHFHDDDIYDFEWSTNLSFTVPKNMPSGIYVMRFSSGEYEDALPFYVCPSLYQAPLNHSSLKQTKKKLLVLVSTYTYTIYGNHARPDYKPNWQMRIKEWGAYPYNPSEYSDYGLSTYNNHSDGSGICHASYKRPLLNLRPGYITFGEANCSGLRHFQADSHLISWLHAKNIDYDVITDEELHKDGVRALEGYAAVTTASHPEYHTKEMLDALMEYRDGGGALHYLGGNGFYWRIAQHQENNGVFEIRRAEDGIRAWAAEPGEYYNAFDGSYGGLWRRNGRAPQSLVGIGFTAQGEFSGAPYKRNNFEDRLSWIFDGIQGDLIGDFGFSGNGAAGYELDNIGNGYNVTEHLTVLAQSMNLAKDFMLVPEEQLTHLTNLSGETTEETLRADMIYLELPNGGRVFSTGSITFCGSLPWNNFDNNVSTLLENVFRKHLQ